MSALIPALIDLLVSRLRARGGGGGGGASGGEPRGQKPQMSLAEKNLRYWGDELLSQKRLATLDSESDGGGRRPNRSPVPSLRDTYKPPQ
jgi:hypothetical protein